MSVDVTWPRYGPVSDEEKLLRAIFEYTGTDPDYALHTTLLALVERYRDRQVTT